MPTAWLSRRSPSAAPSGMGDRAEGLGPTRRKLRSVHELPTAGKRVLVRVDCNVAVDEESRPLPRTDQRLRAILPTVEYLRGSGARVLLLSHLGRPDGRVVEALRLDDIARRLGVLLGAPVRYIPSMRGQIARSAAATLRAGEILLLENLRFDPGEERADPSFAADLASLGDAVVQDAFADAHRRHASVAVLPTLLPSAAGLLVESEVAALQRILDAPDRPVVAIMGGAKLETKLGLVANLLPRVDHLLTGGGIANTFLHIAGLHVDRGLVDAHPPAEAVDLFARFRARIHLPTDVRVQRAGMRESLILPVSAVTAADEILDVGPETTETYCQALVGATLCVWNGPLGRFETPPFDTGTTVIARCLASARAFSVVGGGDTVRALEELGLTDAFDHVSTGGGAMLAFLSGDEMPGLEPLYEGA